MTDIHKAMQKFSEVNQEIEEALKQPQQEPVAWVYNGILHEFDPSEFATSEVKPLYTAPPISDYHEGWEEGFKAATREQEPVGYVTIENISSWAQVPSIKWFKKPTEGPLYTAPPKREWVGLTDEELKPLCHEWQIIYGGYVRPFAETIEAKLKEKNT